MSRRAILLLVAMNAAIIAAVYLIFNNGLRDSTALIGIVLLGLAYLLRRNAMARLPYDETTKHPEAPRPGHRERNGSGNRIGPTPRGPGRPPHRSERSRQRHHTRTRAAGMNG